VPAGLGVPSVPVTSPDGVPVVGANDLARLLDASRSWRSDVRKLVLRRGEHRLTFTEGNPFVLVDDRTLRLSAPVLMHGGELQVPVELARLLPPSAQPGGWPRVAYDADARVLRVAPAAGFVGAPRVNVRGGVTEIVIPSEHAEAAAVVGRSRARFRLRLAGGLTGALPDSLPYDGLLRDVAASPAPNGLTFELAVDPAANGWRLERDPDAGRVTLALSRNSDAGGFEAFASEGARGPRALHVIVLDPGHGGSDAGVQSDGVSEKQLTLDLARAVGDELRHRSPARVVLTRVDDRDLSQEERAELANRADADVIVSLHFGMSPDPRLRGATAWCPPAGVPANGATSAADASPARAANPRDANRAASVLELVPWHDAALQSAVESRGLAESLTDALERAGFGPASVRERLPLALVGVQAPGVMLECGTLSDPDERSRLLSPEGFQRLASAIAVGILAWQRGEL